MCKHSLQPTEKIFWAREGKWNEHSLPKTCATITGRHFWVDRMEARILWRHCWQCSGRSCIIVVMLMIQQRTSLCPRSCHHNFLIKTGLWCWGGPLGCSKWMTELIAFNKDQRTCLRWGYWATLTILLTKMSPYSTGVATCGRDGSNDSAGGEGTTGIVTLSYSSSMNQDMWQQVVTTTKGITGYVEMLFCIEQRWGAFPAHW